MLNLMLIRNQLYIDGKWVDGNGKVPVFDPSNGEVITEVEQQENQSAMRQ